MSLSYLSFHYLSPPSSFQNLTLSFTPLNYAVVMASQLQPGRKEGKMELQHKKPMFKLSQ